MAYNYIKTEKIELLAKEFVMPKCNKSIQYLLPLGLVVEWEDDLQLAGIRSHRRCT